MRGEGHCFTYHYSYTRHLDVYLMLIVLLLFIILLKPFFLRVAGEWAKIRLSNKLHEGDLMLLVLLSGPVLTVLIDPESGKQKTLKIEGVRFTTNFPHFRLAYKIWFIAWAKIRGNRVLIQFLLFQIPMIPNVGCPVDTL